MKKQLNQLNYPPEIIKAALWWRTEAPQRQLRALVKRLKNGESLEDYLMLGEVIPQSFRPGWIRKWQYQYHPPVIKPEDEAQAA